MKYLLDTNAFRDLMMEHPNVARRLAGMTSADTVSICSIVRGEVLFGIERLPPGKRRDNLAGKAGILLESLGEEAVPSLAGDHYARLKRERQRLGLSMDENDLWIAATAIGLGATVVTRDKDFRATTGLLVEDWTA